MIIKYVTYGDKYSTFLYVPDSTPWKLTVELEDFIEGSEVGEEEDIINYAVKLITGSGMEETIINSEDCENPLFPQKVENWDEEILDLFNYIVEEASDDLAYAQKNGDRVFDLGATILLCKEEWTYQLKRAAKGGDDNEN